MPRASSLAAAIQDAHATEPTLTPGDGGIFEVLVDGDCVFSKQREGRFPSEDEIVARLARDA
ncbi:MAG: Rdx family protein [Myxococcota bacterium]|nr:Rdx family protein [Myxococcota bacterium]